MKLFELTEKALVGGRAPLYHWTPWVFLDDILRLDALGVVSEWDSSKGALGVEKGWVSVTRSQHYIKGRRDEVVRLVLDGTLVQQNFKMRPYVDWMVAKNRDENLNQIESKWESEEIVRGPIKPLSKYLLKIQMGEQLYKQQLDAIKNFEGFVAKAQEDLKAYDEGYFRLGQAHKTHPNQLIKFDDFVKVSNITPEKAQRHIAGVPASLKKTIEVYTQRAQEHKDILNHPKLQVGFTQS